MALDNLFLTKLTKSDFPQYYLLVGNEQVMAMITEKALSIQEAEKGFEKILNGNALHPDFGFYKITDSISGNFLGVVKLEIEKQAPKEAELGYMILPEHWGKGIGGKVSEMMLNKARLSDVLEKITAIIDPKNIASRKILINNGFHSLEFKDFDDLPGEILVLNLTP